MRYHVSRYGRLGSIVGIFLLPWFIFGCIPVAAHYGADLSKLSQFKIEKGTTTEKDLVTAFGDPGHTMDRGDGRRILTWSDSRSDSAIPLTGSGTVSHTSLSATIRDGIVVDYNISNGVERH